MTTGATVAVVAGVGAVGVGAFLLLRSRAAAANAGRPGAVAAASAAGTSSTAASTPTLQTFANGVTGLSSGGCAAVAGKYGAPSSLAALGCSAYTKYATPWGLATTALNEVEKIPYVGGVTKDVVNGVSAVVTKPIKAIGNFIGGLF